MSSTPHKFRLERIRTLRERSEDQAKQALADSLGRHQVAEQNVAVADARIAAARQSLAGLSQTTADAAAMCTRQMYLEHTEAAHQASVEVLDSHVRDVDLSRDRLLEAARDRQSMDRLRDRHLAAHQIKAGRHEAALLDEIALNTFRRRTRT